MMNTEVILDELEGIDTLALPKSKTEKGILKRALVAASKDEPLSIYVGSCPDYSHCDGLYTHQSLGEGVPLLTQSHLRSDIRMLQVLDKFCVPYRYVVMIADVEGTDEFFCKKFTDDDEAEFLSRCALSVTATRNYLTMLQGEQGIKGDLKSTSFFDEFGRDVFLTYQSAYQNILQEIYLSNSTFSQRVEGDMAKRMDLYRTMYRERIGFFQSNEDRQFLVGRTIRTMAQYLTLGRLISEGAKHPVIINHPTRNIGLFNDRNKFVLPDDLVQGQPTIPIFETKQKVY